MNRLFIATGPDGVIEAAEALLDTERYDMAAVAGVFESTNPLLESLDDGSCARNLENFQQLREQLPQLDVVHGIIAAKWEQEGYTDMELSGSFFLDQWRASGLTTHVDELVYRRRIEAGLQLSLCLKGLRQFWSERLPQTFKTESGAFDRQAFEEFIAFGSPLYSEFIAGRVPRTAALLRPGDLAMFPHHPVISMHKSAVLEPGSIGRLISYNAETVVT
jgi:hypothetical protein